VGNDQQQPNAGGVDALKYQKTGTTAKVGVSDAEPSDEWLTVKLRHKSPEGDISSLEESVVKGPVQRWQESGDDFVFASTVALFGMKLRGMDEGKSFTWAQLHEFAIPAAKNDPTENRAEFVQLLKMLDQRYR
jgi:Ca-activated chloride channel homolog